MDDFQKQGSVQLDSQTAEAIRDGYISASITDEQTLSTMADVYKSRDGYLLDPHGAVAVAAADMLADTFAPDTKIVCLATAHAAKFPDVVRKALSLQKELPEQAMHPSIEKAKERFQHVRLCDCSHLTSALTRAMQSVTNSRANSSKDDQ